MNEKSNFISNTYRFVSTEARRERRLTRQCLRSIATTRQILSERSRSGTTSDPFIVPINTTHEVLRDILPNLQSRVGGYTISLYDAENATSHTAGIVLKRVNEQRDAL